MLSHIVLKADLERLNLMEGILLMPPDDDGYDEDPIYMLMSSKGADMPLSPERSTPAPHCHFQDASCMAICFC